jgi:hypothetical protein
MAQPVGDRYPTAPDPYREIQIYDAADALPSTSNSGDEKHRLILDFEALRIPFRYKLYPQCVDGQDGPAVAYYTAYHVQRQRVDYVVGPPCLDQFCSEVVTYHIAANYLYGVTNSATKHDINSFKLVDLAFKGDWRGVIRQLGKSWKDKLQDPYWYMENILAWGGVAMAAEARAAGALSPGQAIAREAGKQILEGEPSAAVTVGKNGMPDSLLARIEVDPIKKTVTYHVSGLNAIDATTGSVKGTGESVAKAAHREALIQSAQAAQREGAKTFVVYGEMCNPNGMSHMKNLFNKMGEPGTFEVLKRGGEALPNVKFKLRAEAVLNSQPKPPPVDVSRYALTGASAAANRQPSPR